MVARRFSFHPDELLASASRRFLDQFIDLAGAGSAREPALRELDRQIAFWGDRRCGDAVPSTIGSPAGSPLECSLALEGEKQEVRWSVELTTPEGTRDSYREASNRYLEMLAEEHPRARSILSWLQSLDVELYTLHGVVCAPGRPPAHKLYLHGAHRNDPWSFPWRRVLEELDAPVLAEALARTLSPHERPSFIALDLDESPSARVKAYVQAQSQLVKVSVPRYEALTPSAEPGAIARFRAHALQGYAALGNLEAWSLTARPGSGTDVEHVTHFVMNVPHLIEPLDDDERSPPVGSDRFFQNSVHAVLRAHDLSPLTYDRVLEGLSTDAPEDSYYFNTHLSYQQRKGGEPRVTAYFAPQIYAGRMGEVYASGGQLRR